MVSKFKVYKHQYADENNSFDCDVQASRFDSHLRILQKVSKIDKNKQREQIILGLDPGTSVMGYGLICVIGQQLRLLQFGVIHLSKYTGHELKLKKIFERITSLIDDYHPDEVALEAPFYGKNVQSMLKLGRAQGVAMAAALSREVPITEYAPKKVKQSVTSNGNASKEQVAAMLMTLLKFKETPKLLDATDALAVAVCHHFQKGTAKASVKSWKAFVSENPKRIG
ncbi:crossover junction endodeoxyribonuclease RuvC [Fulvivirga sp. M361]|nr:crossover junction endodeoxyribonuclease RuvC [Fulvivirga sp. M361]